MNERPTIRTFVPRDAIRDGTLVLADDEARRVYMRGVRRQDRIIALDGSGWGYEVELTDVGWTRCTGRVMDRRVAPERRTKITLYHGLLSDEATRHLVFAATAAGIVAYHPLITDRSVVPDGDQRGTDLARLARTAAETAGRGRIPRLSEPVLLDRAIDLATRSGERLLMAAHRGSTVPDALEGRPFAVSLLCPPPAGFTPSELERAATLGARPVSPSTAGNGPEGRTEEGPAGPADDRPFDDEPRAALALIDAVYDLLESPARE